MGGEEASNSLMMEPSESRKEARIRKTQILTTKEQTRIGTWNVRTLYITGKLAQVTIEMQKYKLHILGVSEMRWTESGKMMSDGITVYYSGGKSKHEWGVEILLSQNICGAVIIGSQSTTELSWSDYNPDILK